MEEAKIGKDARDTVRYTSGREAANLLQRRKSLELDSPFSLS